MRKSVKYQRHQSAMHQVGVTMLPILAAVASIVIITIWVDIPQQVEQQQKYQAIANINTSVQLLSAMLSFYRKNDEWAQDIAELAEYLPIIPAGNNLNNIAKLIKSEGGALLFNAQTHTHAKKLAWQFTKLEIDIVDKDDNKLDAGIWVKITLNDPTL